MAPSGRELREAVREPSGEKRSIIDIHGAALMRRATLYNIFHRGLPSSVAQPLAPSLPEGGIRRNTVRR